MHKFLFLAIAVFVTSAYASDPKPAKAPEHKASAPHKAASAPEKAASAPAHKASAPHKAEKPVAQKKQ